MVLNHLTIYRSKIDHRWRIKGQSCLHLERKHGKDTLRVGRVEKDALHSNEAITFCRLDNDTLHTCAQEAVNAQAI